MSPHADARRSFKLLDWAVLAISLISFSLLLRLSFLGMVDFLSEEAYYWAYGQNLDFSYLDHPPMVAFREDDLRNPSLAKYFDRIDPVLEQEIFKNGRTLGRFLYRVGYGYQTDNFDKPSPRKVASLSPVS
jgi:hypothetical protein